MTTIEVQTYFTCRVCPFAARSFTDASQHAHDTTHAVGGIEVTRFHTGSNEWAATLAELIALGHKVLGMGMDDTGWWLVTWRTQ